MFIVVIETKEGTKTNLDLFNKDRINEWKFKDDWLKDIDTNYSDIPHKKVYLINNVTKEVILEKELKNFNKYNPKYPLQYFKNVIYDTVRKLINMRLYKKDKYGLTYAIIPFNGYDSDPVIDYGGAISYYGYCESPYITGELCESEDKAFTNVKKITYERLLNLGIKVSQTYINDVIIPETNNKYPIIYGY